MFRATILAATVIKRLSNFGQVLNRVAKTAHFAHKYSGILNMTTFGPWTIGRINWLVVFKGFFKQENDRLSFISGQSKVAVSTRRS